MDERSVVLVVSEASTSMNGIDVPKIVDSQIVSTLCRAPRD